MRPFPNDVSPNWKYSGCRDDLFPVIERNRLVLGEAIEKVPHLITDATEKGESLFI
jgi:hypothetical protein